METGLNMTRLIFHDFYLILVTLNQLFDFSHAAFPIPVYVHIHIDRGVC